MGRLSIILIVGVIAVPGCSGGTETATTEPVVATTTAATTTTASSVLETTTTELATTTTEPAVQLLAPTDISFEAKDCPSTVRQDRNESCLVIAHFRDQSVGEDSYLFVVESDYLQNTFESDGPAFPGAGQLISTPGEVAMVGYRFCLTVYAVEGTTQSPASARVCARIADGGTIELVS